MPTGYPQAWIRPHDVAPPRPGPHGYAPLLLRIRCLMYWRLGYDLVVDGPCTSMYPLYPIALYRGV